MNLETLRKNNFTEKCLNIHDKNKNKHDQWIINKYAEGKHTFLKSRFNIFLNQDDYLVCKEVEFILHYAGSKKPITLTQVNINTYGIKISQIFYLSSKN